MFLTEYLNVFVFLLVTVFLAVVIFFLSYTLIQKSYTLEKTSAYECGFDPFDQTREPFNIRFYLTSILFLIFDLEVSFLFPWSISISTVGYFGMSAIFLFLFLLTIAFFYEWFEGALEWD